MHDDLFFDQHFNFLNVKITINKQTQKESEALKRHIPNP